MKFSRKTQLDTEIPTASMPDIIFMLLIFFMVTTVLREYSGLPISLPKAKRIEKLKSKRHTSHIWVSKEGLISIEDKLYASEGVRHIMYEKRVADPQLVVSLKADERAKMGPRTLEHEYVREDRSSCETQPGRNPTDPIQAGHVAPRAGKLAQGLRPGTTGLQDTSTRAWPPRVAEPPVHQRNLQWPFRPPQASV